jgi:hypothetical protein
MRRIVAVFILMFVFSGGFVAAQFPEAQPGCQGCTPEEAAKIAKLHAMPQAVGGPIGTPTFVMPQAKSGGFIQIGQAFGDFLQPYIDAAVYAILSSLIGWLCIQLQRRTGIEIDQKHREALAHALSNQAGSLIADGLVKIEGEKISVPSEALASAATELMKTIPDAAKHFGITPDYVAARIIDTIPQIAAGAQMIAKKAQLP